MANLNDYETFKVTMNKEEINAWFVKKLNRPPEPWDFYNVCYSKQGRQGILPVGVIFTRTSMSAAICKIVITKVTLPGAVIVGRHLMGYCFLNLGESDRALKEFKKCIKDGYDEDWQLVVELTIEVEQKRRNQTDLQIYS
jgi:hypothetical protein